MSHNFKVPGKKPSRKRSEQQYKHIFTYQLPDGKGGLEEKKTAEVVAKSIPGACEVFADTYKKAFVSNVAVEKIEKEQPTVIIDELS